MDLIAYPKIAQLHRVTEELEGRYVVVQEKLDGSNVAIVRTEDGVYFQSRNRVLDRVEDRKGIFRPFLDWALACEADGLFDLMPAGLVLYGETLANQGKVTYGEVHPFVLFDVFDQATGQFIQSDAFDPLTRQRWHRAYSLGLGEQIESTWTYYTRPFASLTEEHLQTALSGNVFKGQVGSESLSEGIVIKAYPQGNEAGIGTYNEPVLAAKLVNERFAESKRERVAKMPKDAVDPIAEIVAAVVTEARIDKAKLRVREDGNDPNRHPHHTIKYLVNDVKAECEDDIKIMLFQAYWKQIGGRIAQQIVNAA